LHRDVKPENFLFGLGPKAAHVYLVDFGLSRRYIEQGRHIPRRNNCSPVGTMRYASVNVLRGVTPSRRDDLEALGYVVVYLALGYLPWSGLGPFLGDDLHEMRWRILERKESVSLDVLCDGLPEGLETYLREVRALSFAETPDYSRLCGHLTSMRGSADRALPWLRGIQGLEPIKPWRSFPQPKQETLQNAGGSPWEKFTASFCTACSCQEVRVKAEYVAVRNRSDTEDIMSPTVVIIDEPRSLSDTDSDSDSSSGN